MEEIRIFWKSQLSEVIKKELWRGSYHLCELDGKFWVAFPFKGNEKSPEEEGIFAIQQSGCLERDIRGSVPGIFSLLNKKKSDESN